MKKIVILLCCFLVACGTFKSPSSQFKKGIVRNPYEVSLYPRALRKDRKLIAKDLVCMNLRSDTLVLVESYSNLLIDTFHSCTVYDLGRKKILEYKQEIKGNQLVLVKKRDGDICEDELVEALKKGELEAYIKRELVPSCKTTISPGSVVTLCIKKGEIYHFKYYSTYLM